MVLWAAVLVVSAVLVVPCTGRSTGTIVDADGIATSQAPGQHCTSHPPALMHALRQGDARLVLVVKAFIPPTPAHGRLAAWLMADGGRTRQEVGRFALYPPRGFSQQEPAHSQRFLLALDAAAALLSDGQPVCIQAGFDPEGAPGNGGRLVFAVEVVHMPPAPR